MCSSEPRLITRKREKATIRRIPGIEPREVTSTECARRSPPEVAQARARRGPSRPAAELSSSESGT
jgi:hypothetical protein